MIAPTSNLVPPADAGRLSVHVESKIAWLGIDNPSRHNSLTLRMLNELPPLLSSMGSDDGIRVLIVHGASAKAFCAGVDISEFGALRTAASDRTAYSTIAKKAFRSLRKFPKPTIAMIGGHCIGGGLVMALNCDIRIASEGSRFAIPAAKLGLGFGSSDTRVLLNATGPGWAYEILYSGRTLTADEALDARIINRVTSTDELKSSASELAEAIARNAPLTVRASKAVIADIVVGRQQTKEKRSISRLLDACFESKDYLEGQNAFKEKRTPKFDGR